MMDTKGSKKMTFDRREAARRLGVSLVTVDRELAKKRLPHLRIGRRVLFTDEILQTYIAKNTKNA